MGKQAYEFLILSKLSQKMSLTNFLRFSISQAKFLINLFLIKKKECIKSTNFGAVFYSRPSGDGNIKDAQGQA